MVFCRKEKYKKIFRGKMVDCSYVCFEKRAKSLICVLKKKKKSLPLKKERFCDDEDLHSLVLDFPCLKGKERIGSKLPANRPTNGRPTISCEKANDYAFFFFLAWQMLLRDASRFSGFES